MAAKRKYDTVVFDLDGTLLDTLDDLKNSANYAASLYGIRSYSREEISSFVGNGIRRLISLVVPGGEEDPNFDGVFRAFTEHYAIHCNDETKPYTGIMQMLSDLQAADFNTAIVSNKADFAVKKLNELYFGRYIRAAIGERDGCRRKPAPDSVLQAIEEVNGSLERAVYVGDSEVDLLTAGNAGMDCVLVTWGFRSREFLMEHGAKESQMADTVEDLLRIICG